MASLLLSVVVLMLALGGCSVFSATKKPDDTAAPALSKAGPPLVDLQVDAPRELKALLQNNLDLGRLTVVAGQEAVSDTEIDRLIAATPAQARQLLETEGYFQANVQVHREPGDAPPHVKVTVQPGPQVHVGQVDFEVEGALERKAAAGDVSAQISLRTLRESFQLKPGDPFRNARWSEAKNAALVQLRADGYASATWHSTRAEVDAAANEARVVVVADSGPRFLAGPIVVKGLERQDEESVRNLAGFQAGAPLTEQTLVDYQERLQTSGLFDRATVVLDPDPEHAAAATITVQVHEQSLQQATAGIGYSANAGPRASLEHWDRKLFGFDVTERTKLDWGADEKTLAGDVSTHVGPDLWRDLIGYTIDEVKTSTDTVTSAQGRVGRGQDLPRRQREYYVEATTSIRTTGDTRQQGAALTVDYDISWRELNNLILPTDGWSLSLQDGVGRAHDELDRAGPFARLYGRLTGYKSLPSNWYGSARIELGQIFAPNVNVPDVLRFRAGGDDSVRGYSYRTLAPLASDGTLMGGKSLFTASIEFAHPIVASLPSVLGAVFVDAGNAAESFGSLKLAYGPGVGVHWRSPVGPLKVDLAYGTQTQALHLHVSVGVTF